MNGSSAWQLKAQSLSRHLKRLMVQLLAKLRLPPTDLRPARAALQLLLARLALWCGHPNDVWTMRSRMGCRIGLPLWVAFIASCGLAAQ
jgi:hypothetical protein